MNSRWVTGLALAGVLVAGTTGSAQTIESITFEDAIRRATTANPGVQRAAAGIMRAEALLQQVRARLRPSVDASFSTNVIDPVVQFSGTSINPRTQTVTGATVAIPILTSVRWAERAQAADQILVSQASAADVRRQVALATAEAYLVIIAQRRVLERNDRSRENALAHYTYAMQRFEGGIGSRLNMLRAQQELSSDEALVEDAQLSVRRAQEALGVLVAADGPVDASAEPMFEVAGLDGPVGVPLRTDIQFLAARQSAAERVLSDTWKDSLPSVSALFAPQYLAPSGLFVQPRSVRVSLTFSVPLFDGAERRARTNERHALLDSVKAERLGVERLATSEVRTAREAVRLTERALERARAATSQADEVVSITDVAFREGATTNIEVIDAQRRARDAGTAAAIAEDAVRRARLELLVALGRFPQ
ncbi:MAG: TolC family protein [Vicinamibacterales bacterium]